MHFTAPEGCDVRAELPVEGITDKLQKQLQCRKKLYAGQTEAERWQQVYQLLFPNEIVPSPCKSALSGEPSGFKYSTTDLPQRILLLRFKLGHLADILRL
jgi:hypothetical protein